MRISFHTFAISALATIAAASIGTVALEARPADKITDQPEMSQAITQMEGARDTLRKAASTDKGGHRLKAMSLLTQAIAETRRGVVYDGRH